MPFFSIIISTYNRSHTLGQAIRSLLGQTFENWEAIIIDDGSTDDTRSLCAKVIAMDKRFHYLHHENKGPGYSKNRGLKASSGKYLTFLDSDDLYKRNHLESRRKFLEDNPDVDLLHGGFEIIGPEYVPDIANPGEKIPVADCIVGGTFVVEREKAIEIGGFGNLRFGDDTEFYTRAETAGIKIARFEKKTYIYNRKESDSLCNRMMQK